MRITPFDRIADRIRPATDINALTPASAHQELVPSVALEPVATLVITAPFAPALLVLTVIRSPNVALLSEADFNNSVQNYVCLYLFLFFLSPPSPKKKENKKTIKKNNFTFGFDTMLCKLKFCGWVDSFIRNAQQFV